jgi:hypothetical protein
LPSMSARGGIDLFSIFMYPVISILIIAIQSIRVYLLKK